MAVLAPFATAASPAPSAAPSGPSTPEPEGFAPRFTHIMVVVMENQSLNDIMVKNPAAKYILNELTPQSGLAVEFYAPKRNSPTAYFAMASGHLYTEGDGGGHWAGKCGPSAECSSDDETVFEQLGKAGRNWRIYSEDQSRPCQTKNADKYWVGHNAAVFFTRLGPNDYTDSGDGSCMKHDIGIEALSRDIAEGTVPEYTHVIPNNCDNMHDECYPIRDRVLQGNAWLERALGGDEIVAGGLINWARANDTLLIVTFDEARLETDREGCCPYVPTGGGGHIPTWVLGPEGKVKVGYESSVLLSNYSVLRAVQENWDLPLLGHAADVEAVANLNDFLILTDEQAPVPPPNPAPRVDEVAPTRTPSPAAAGGGSGAGRTGAPVPGSAAVSPVSSGTPIIGVALAIGVILIVGLVALKLRDSSEPGPETGGRD